MLTVPNLLSGVRFLLIPGLLGLAYFGRGRLFLLVLIFTLLTDALDGYFARKLKQMTRLGAKLDSWADVCTWLVLPLCGWWLRPEVLRAEALWLGIGLACYLASILIGFVKYGRLISYHTWLAKALAVLLAGVVLVFFAGGRGWVLRAVIPVIILSAIEEIAMTALLPTWQADVPTFWHALRLRTRGKLARESAANREHG